MRPNTEQPGSVIVPVEETLMTWTDGRHARGEIAPNTWRASRYHIAKFAEYFSDGVDLRSIRPGHIDLWLETLTVSAQTRNTICSTLRTFFAWAVRREILDRNPFVDVTNAKVPTRLPRRVSRKQVEIVLEGSDFRTRVMITLAVQLGLRRAELAGLRVEDWDRAEGLLMIRGKGSRERMAAVEGEIEDALTAWLADGRTSGPMWPSVKRPERGLSSNRVGGIIIAAAEKHGLHITPHQYRHTMASESIMDGTPLEVLRRQLGHASIATTGVYTAANIEELRPYTGTRRYYRGSWGAKPTCDHTEPTDPEDGEQDLAS